MKPAYVWSTLRFFERNDARVWLDPGGENSIRAASTGQGHAWQVRVQGWPNLVHELAHVLQSGKLDEDSGFEYHLVPLCLDRPRGRGYLWDELCACALSCAWGRERADGSWVGAWFKEQVDILPVFFGDEGDPQRFLAKVDRCLAEHAWELVRAQARLWAMAHQLDDCDAPGRAGELAFPGLSTARDEAALADLGLTPVKGPFCVFDLWRDYRMGS